MMKPAPALGGTAPSMASLRAFEAAARLGGFTEAATQLCVSTSAISHQVRALEEFTRMRLFVRERQRVRLSAAGEQLLPAVRLALDTLGHALQELRPGHLRARVTVLPSLASAWLMPRLPDFSARHPQVDLQICASQTLEDLAHGDFDLGLRFGMGDWPGLHALRLGGDSLLPVASPALLAGRAAQGLRLLRHAPLLRDDAHPWSDYLRAHAISPRAVRFGAQYNDCALLLQAARAGQGVVLARALLAADALRRGELLPLGPAMPVPARAYYLVARRPLDETAAGARRFGQWLAGQFEGATPAPAFWPVSAVRAAAS